MTRHTYEPDPDWREWMIAAQDGDSAAYAQLLHAATPFLRAAIAQRSTGAEATERVVQQTLLTIHRLRHTYDPQTSMERWLTAIAEAEAKRAGQPTGEGRRIGSLSSAFGRWLEILSTVGVTIVGERANSSRTGIEPWPSVATTRHPSR